MRNHKDADLAYIAGAILPEDIRAYTAGAVAFKNNKFPQAIDYFKKVLALPKGKKERREVWASYMIAKSEFENKNFQSAEQFFQKVRELVSSGAKDPFGLAVDSLGDEARIHLESGKISRAVELYFQEASHSSPVALNSLDVVANKIVENKKYLANSYKDLLIRSLVIYYANVYGWPQDHEDDSNPDHPGKGSNSLNRVGNPFVEQFVSSFEKDSTMSPLGASWLAGAIYNEGWFDLAERLIAREKSPMSIWVAAKLAVRRGDMDKAAILYREAIGLLKNDAAINKDLLCSVRADLGSYHVSRNEYVSALKLFFDLFQESWNGSRLYSEYWADIAYISEKVLTIDELKNFVSENVPESIIAQNNSRRVGLNSTPATELRHLLGRRLMRSGRFDEAPSFFDDKALKSKASTYAYIHRFLNAFWIDDISKSQILFELAKMAHDNGMELLGYELEPDYAISNGRYGEDSGYSYEEDGESETDSSDLENDNSTINEMPQKSQNSPDESYRFHYRLVATKYLSHAANLVPPRSQAFAALLCQANAYIRYRYPEKALPFYHRYVKEGAFVPWAKHFGSQCPKPDFLSARKHLLTQTLVSLHRDLKPHKTVFSLFFIVTAIGISWLWIMQLKRRPYLTHGRK